MKRINQIISDIQNINLQNRVVEIIDSEDGKYDKKVRVEGSGFSYRFYGNWGDIMRGNGKEVLYYDGDFILEMSTFKGRYDRKVIEETENCWFDVKGIDWSTTQFENFEAFLNGIRGEE